MEHDNIRQEFCHLDVLSAWNFSAILRETASANDCNMG
jgi:hypothetical protein